MTNGGREIAAKRRKDREEKGRAKIRQMHLYLVGRGSRKPMHFRRVSRASEPMIDNAYARGEPEEPTMCHHG